MLTAIQAASYICQCYQEKYGSRIDEMKLHKLLYFSQRECIIQTDEPMFSEQFEAWKYGPVMVFLRDLYRTDSLHETMSVEDSMKYKAVFEKVFETLAGKSSWSLSTLSHGEYSWKKAREGYVKDAHCEVEILTDDIKVDAERVRIRRFLLAQWQTLNQHKSI